MSRDSNSVWEGGAVCEEKPKDLILLACFEVVYDSRSDTMSSQYFPASVQKLEFVFNTATHCKDCDNAARQCLKSHMIESSSSLCLFFCSTLAGSRRKDRGKRIEAVFLEKSLWKVRLSLHIVEVSHGILGIKVSNTLQLLSRISNNEDAIMLSVFAILLYEACTTANI
eukprot:scaffold155_cov234-Chaetoceros_neogracile.AAC.11